MLQKWNELWFAETLEVEYVGLVEQARLRCKEPRIIEIN